MHGFNLIRFGGEPEGLSRDAYVAGGFAQVEPRFLSVGRRTEDRNPVVRSQRGDPFARPAIAMASQESIAVEDAGNQIVIGDQSELLHGSDDIGRGAVALSSSPLRQPQLGVNCANPMDQQDDLGRIVVDIGDHLVNKGAHDALLQSGIGLRVFPDCFEIDGKAGDVRRRQRRWGRCRGIVRRNLGLDLADPRKRPVPSRLQFCRHEPVLRVGNIILARCPIGVVTSRLQITHQCITNLIAAAVGLRFGLDGCRDRPWFDHR